MDLQEQARMFESALPNVLPSLQQRFRNQFEDLSKRYAALPANDPNQLALEREIQQLQRDVLSARQQTGEWSLWARISLTIGIIGVVAAYIAYFSGLPADKYASIEGTRPILVFTLIISMLGFGGVLIAAALYGSKSTSEEFENRFRMAREIFLVFSGIFGTIIGFYFGAADETGGGEAPTVEVAFADDRVTAAVSGGTEPFTGIFTPNGAAGGETMAADARLLTFAPTPATCPDGATVLVIDGLGRRAEGTVDCGDESGPAENAVDETSENSSENGI